jgi:GDPmannose 4,6-dehydratase
MLESARPQRLNLYALRRALITGITGQDGSYLSEFLLDKGYQVYGLVRRTSHNPWERIAHLEGHVQLVSGDITDLSSLIRVLEQTQPDEIYNLAAQSFVGESFQSPLATSQIDGLGAMNLFEAVRLVLPRAKVYQASSSEMFGQALEIPQKETTPFYPRSPYAVAKVFAHHAAINYRESYNLFITNGVLFNHESPRRGEEFVTRKISRGVAKIQLGMATEITLGNLNAKRDWGFAGDYVEAMWLMLQQNEPEDFCIGTGEAHTVREFLDLAFAHIGVSDWTPYVRIDPSFYRPTEADILLADPSKAQEKLGWKPKVDFEALVSMMVQADHHALLPAAAAHRPNLSLRMLGQNSGNNEKIVPQRQGDFQSI